MNQEMKEKIEHSVLEWKQTLNLRISSAARMIYVYLSSFFNKFSTILQSQIKLDSIYTYFDLGNTFRISSEAC